MLIYDGDCRFCTRRASWFQRRARRENLAVAYQDLELGEFSEVGLTQDVVSQQAVWVDPDGRQFLGHKAVAKSLLHIGGAWKILGYLMLLPPISWIARGVYRAVASNRHRF